MERAGRATLYIADVSPKVPLEPHISEPQGDADKKLHF